MKALRLLLGLLLIPSLAFAQQNTITVDNSAVLPVKTTVGTSVPVTYEFTNNTPLQLPLTFNVANSNMGSALTLSRNNCTLQPKGSAGDQCTLTLTYSPTTANVGDQYFTLQYIYGNNQISLAQQSTQTASPDNPVTVLVSPELPDNVVAGSNPSGIMVKMSFTNTSTTQTINYAFTHSANLPQDPANPSSCAATGGSLPPGGACQYYGLYTPPATIPSPQTQSVSGVLSFTSNNVAMTTTGASSTVVVPPGDRTIHFVNDCPVPVWLGISGGAVNTNPCTDDTQCPNGSVCAGASTTKTGLCFWKDMVPSTYELTAGGSAGSAVTVAIPTTVITVNGQPQQWSGGFAARTGCTAQGCMTGDCSDSDGACDPGRGFTAPVTVAEFTFVQNAPDNYDIEVINGFNVPMKVSPVQELINPSDPYNCGSPGDTSSQGALSGCSWQFSPPSPTFVYVSEPSGGPVACTQGSCASGQVCGYAKTDNNPKSTSIVQTCGAPLGYWTANQLCSAYSAPNGTGAPASLNCDMAISTPTANQTLTNLLQCAPSSTAELGTCYANGANTYCCGCVNWGSVPGMTISVPPAPATLQCQNYFGGQSGSGTWWTDVLPNLKFLKQACPSIYVYPYDDATAKFGCAKLDASNNNTVAYTITFCPNGQMGTMTTSSASPLLAPTTKTALPGIIQRLASF